MKHVVTASTLAIGLAWGFNALAAPAGTLLFTQPGSQIVDDKGDTRPAKRGDILQTGERLLTPPGAISQIRLPDGSLVGARPGSELKFELPGAASDRAATVVALVQGAVRVIGAELMDASKPSAFSVRSGPATLKIQSADLETAVVPPDANRPAGGNNPGSYNRLLLGTASIDSGSQLTPLSLRQVSFVSTANVAPITLSTVSPTLFSPTISLSTTTLSPLTTEKTSTILDPVVSSSTLSTSTLSPTLVTSTLTSPLTTSTLSSQLLQQPISTTSLSTSTLSSSTLLTSSTTTTSTTTTTLAIKPVYIAPVYIAPVTTVKTCTFSLTGLKVCR